MNNEVYYMKKINPKLLKNYISFSEWETDVEKLFDSNEKGDAMELLVYFYLSDFIFGWFNF